MIRSASVEKTFENTLNMFFEWQFRYERKKMSESFLNKKKIGKIYLTNDKLKQGEHALNK